MSLIFHRTFVRVFLVLQGQADLLQNAEGITELFMAELAKQSGVRVVDRTSLDRVVAEMRFQSSDWSNSQKTAQLGAALNAEFLVRGQLNQLGQQISFVITALDIKTLEVVSSSTQNFRADNIFTDDNGALFGYVSSGGYGGKALWVMATLIANPIKTKMVQLAEQRKKEQEEREKQQQEQARLREQSQYSLVGTWTRGNFNRSDTFTNLRYMSDNSKESAIRQSRADGKSSTRWLLSFSVDGTMQEYDESYGSSSFTQYYRKGTYIRKGDQLEYSTSGTKTTLRGSNWSNWNSDYRDYKESTENSSESRTDRIEFRGGGDALIIWGYEFKRYSYAPYN